MLNLEGAWGQNGQQWSLKSPITSPLPVCNGYSWLHHGKAESNLPLNPAMRKVAVTRHVLDKAGPWIQREACSNLRTLGRHLGPRQSEVAGCGRCDSCPGESQGTYKPQVSRM